MGYNTKKIANLSPEARRSFQGACRTAAATIDITKTSEDVERYVEKELERVIDSEGRSFVDALKDKKAAGVAIVVAFKAVGKLVDFIKEGSRTLKAKRKHLRDQMKLGSFVFVVPDDEDDFSSEQRFIDEFMELVRETPIANLESLLGIRTLEPEKSGDSTAYCVFPFSDMDTGATEDVSNTEALGTTLSEIHGRLTVTLPKLRKRLLQSFKGPSKGWKSYLKRPKNWLRSKTEGDNYLNDYIQALFMLTSISNLLWNLQHPMDPDTKKRLSPEECIELCEEVDSFLTAILGSTLPPRLQEKSREPWADYISTARILVRDLQKAYELERLKTFPIKPLATHARETVKMTSIALFELLYQARTEELEKGRDDPSAAEGLVETLRDLRRYLSINPNILKPFETRFELLPKRVANLKDGKDLHDVLNSKPETLMDVLIIFSHLPPEERDAIKNELRLQEAEGQENSGRFLRNLETFDREYIQTLDKTLSTHPKSGYEGAQGRMNRAQLIGQRFIAAIALLVRAYPVSVEILKRDTIDDDDVDEEIAVLNDGSADDPPYLEVSDTKTASEQVALINHLNRAWEEDERFLKETQGSHNLANLKPYFYWRVSDLLDVKKSFGDKINRFPESIEHMTGIAELVEDVAEIVTRYEHVLQNKGFLRFLRGLIFDVRDAQKAFEEMRLGAKEVVSRNESVSDQVQYILSAITKKLQKSLKASAMAAEDVIGLINDPKFSEKKRAEFVKKIEDIDEKYFSVFKRRSKLTRLLVRTKSGCSWGRMNSAFSHGSPTRSPVARQSLRVGSLRRFSDTPPPLDLSSTQSSEDWARELQQFAMIGLIEVCHDSMSYWSQWGHKGTLLKNLKKRVEANGKMTPAELRSYILDLFRVASSYRKTWFGWFQAGYGKDAKSTKALMRAMRDKKVNLVLPLAEVVFGDANIDLSNMQDAEISKHLVSLRQLESWEFSEDEILEKNFRCLQVS
ncbi:MAG: hypothetical protein P1U32_08155 [Legionellaceae bacterium]|nr:hypothetical protein [Legionellaceae bacterium]